MPLKFKQGFKMGSKVSKEQASELKTAIEQGDLEKVQSLVARHPKVLR